MSRANRHTEQPYGVENFKRRRALPPLPTGTSFFNRLLSMRKMKEFVFITKAVAKNR